MIKHIALVGALMIAATPAFAQKGPSASPVTSIFGITLDSYEEGQDNSLSMDGVTARIDQRQNPQNTTTAIFVVTENGREVARFEGPENYMGFLPASLRLVQLDPSSPQPEVIATAYTGGAHCCEDIQIAAVQPDGSWDVIAFGAFDGGYVMTNPNEDATPELQVADQSFLYTFDCYACSWAPPALFAMHNGQIMDISADPSMLPTFAAEMHGGSITPQRYDQPGWLAGWAAVLSRLGEGERALAEIEQGGWGGDYSYDVCSTGGSAFDCAPGNVRQADFATYLRIHLIEQGYIDGPMPTLPGPGRKG